MGNNQTKGVKDSSFFKKQMVIHSQVLDFQKKFAFQNQIGQGTYSTVFKGKSVRSGRPRCIKRVQKSKAPGIEQILLNQFQILRELDHPNIMNIYGLFEDQKHFFVVAELINGQELFSQFKRKKVFEEGEAFEIVKQVVLCLNYLHKNKIMHRDLKLQNMIYNPTTRLLKLIDFGTAVEYSNEAPAQYKLAGTASYIAPEVITKHYNFMCDIWSLGIFLNLILTGHSPFTGKTQEQIFKSISTSPPNLSSLIYDKIPKAKDLVAKMLEKDPRKRITIPNIIKHPWFTAQSLKQTISPADHECMLNIFSNMRKFSTLKIADIQLGVLVFMINFIVKFQNEDSLIRCFHWIDSEGDGVVTEEELALALVEYEDRPQKKAKQQAAEIMRKIDFNRSGDIDYSEFLVAAVPLSSIINQQALESAFRVIDSDLSGKLAPQELKDHLGEHVSEAHYKKIIAFCDLDRDGEISLKEFKETMKMLTL